LKYLLNIVIVSVLLPHSASCQNSASGYGYLQRIPLSKYYTSEIQHIDTLFVMENNFLELVSESGDVDGAQLQARSFKNVDSTITISVVGKRSDQQCSFYHIYFHEYSEKTDSITEIPESVILPELDIEMFLKASRIPKVISKYLKEIEKGFPGASVEKVLREIYSVRFILSPKDEVLTATLNVCDQIMSTVKVAKNDQAIIDKEFGRFNLIYSKEKKKFVLKS
jgi:hypothetical protein